MALVCFNIHIELVRTEMSQTVCLNNNGCAVDVGVSLPAVTRLPKGLVSSNLTTSTKYGVEASMVMQWTVNPPPSGTPGSIPGYSTKYMRL